MAWFIALLAVACGSNDETPDGGAGTSSTGGAGSGGSSAGSGGSNGGSGGSSGAAGSSASGGSSGTSGSGGSGGSAGTGGSGNTPPPPDIDPSRDVLDLTDAERGALCDWSQGMLGGYNHTTDCTATIKFQTYRDQALCIMVAFPDGCSMTVAQWENCQLERVPSRGCVQQSDACRRLFAC